MKHVGKMKNNSARVVVVFRTVPDEPHNCLVVGTQGLSDSYHDSLMALIEGDSGQQANDLSELLSVRKFPDGSNMLGYLHAKGHIKKVPTTMVLMTPNPQTSVPLNEINDLIQSQQGNKPVETVAKTETQSVAKVEEPVQEEPVSASQLRSMADKLFKEAQLLRKKADELEPPKKKVKQPA